MGLATYTAPGHHLIPPHSAGWIRVNRANPCPICDHDHYCSVSPTTNRVFCARVDSPTPGNGGWLHPLPGAKFNRTKPAPRRTPPGLKRPHTPPRPLRPTSAQSTTPPLQRWRIRDYDGETVAVHCRRRKPDGGKELWWTLPDGRRGLSGRKPATLPLYRTETLRSLPAGRNVVLVEGEKAADALVELVPTLGTVTGAAVTPTHETLRVLVGYDVFLWPDNDEPGRRHMRRIATALKDLGVDAKVITWPDAPPGNDAADHPHLATDLDSLLAAAVLAEDTEDEPESVEWNLTDMGNAERLLHRHGPDLRWCAPWKRWIVWNGETWTSAGDELVQERVKETVRSIYDEMTAPDMRPARAEALWKHATRSESASRIAGTINVARSATRLQLAPDDLDRDSWLINCANGTIDLRRGVLLPFTREDLMTKRSPGFFDTAATCPTWLAFLERIFDSQADLIAFMQRAAGYCLSGSTSERVLFILYGEGRNGKTTWLEVIRHVLGDYASGTPASTIMSQRNKGIPNDIARLKGARFVSASETSESAEIDEAFIKIASGGDTVTARFLNAEFFDFRPAFKIWISTNHRPSIRGTDPAVWDRIRLVPFNVRIPEDQLDKALRDKLILESDGILQWLIAGCLDWQRLGDLGVPPIVANATAEYQIDENIVAGFFDDCCDLQRNVSETSARLYNAYKAWSTRTGEEPLSQRRFADRLRQHGAIAARRGGDRERIWRGVRLLAANQDTNAQD